MGKYYLYKLLMGAFLVSSLGISTAQEFENLEEYHQLKTSNVIFSIEEQKYNPRIGIGFTDEIFQQYFRLSDTAMKDETVLSPIKGKFTIKGYNKSDPIVLYFDGKDDLLYYKLATAYTFTYMDIDVDLAVKEITRNQFPEKFLKKDTYILIPEIYVLKTIPNDLNNTIFAVEVREAKSY